MINSMLPLPGLSAVSGKSVVAKFDGGLLSSDGGVLMLREIEQRLRVADRLAGCIEDPRAPDQITHTLADIIRFRLLMIAAGYEDGNDANGLRIDPIFKMAHDLAPSDRELCSQSTISRLENLPDVRTLLRMGDAKIYLYCTSFNVERLIGSIRRECLDHIIILNEHHLRGVLSQYFQYHHTTRTHLSLNKDCPQPRRIQSPSVGKIVAFPEVGGLHHRYERRAA
jgi:hypothetical protein